MVRSIVPLHQILEDEYKVQCVLHRKVSIQTLFQSPIKPFHDTGFNISTGRKKMDASWFHQSLERLVVKLLTIIYLKIDGFSPLFQDLLKRCRYGLTCLVLHVLNPGLFGEHIHHRQEVTVPSIILGNVDYFNQIRVHCSSIPKTNTGVVGNRRLLGLCNVYPKSRSRTSRARRAVIFLALANRVNPPKQPGLRESQYRANSVPVESCFFRFFIISRDYTR